MMKTSLFFIRHGEVQNPQGLWYGRLSRFPLSDLGREQIGQAARYLQAENIDLIFSSPLLRTKQSAEIIEKALNLKKIHFSKEILEVKSSMQGQSFLSLRSIKFNLFASNDNNIVGETIQDVSVRMQRFIQQILKRYRGKHILVVSHGDPIMLVKAMIKGLPIENKSIRPVTDDYIKHAEVYLAEYDDTGAVDIKSVFIPLKLS